MRKAILLDLRVWIEGEDEPAHDWAKFTTDAVKEMLLAGAEARHPGLTVKVRRVREVSV